MIDKISSPQELANVIKDLHAQGQKRQPIADKLGITYAVVRNTLEGKSIPIKTFMRLKGYLPARPMHLPPPSREVPVREEGFSAMLKKIMLDLVEQIIELASYNDPILLKKALAQVSKIVDATRAKRQEDDGK